MGGAGGPGGAGGGGGAGVVGAAPALALAFLKVAIVSGVARASSS